MLSYWNYSIGRICSRQQRFNDAEKYYKLAIRGGLRKYGVQKQLGITLIDQDKWQEAKFLYQDVCAQSEDIDDYIVLSRIYKKLEEFNLAISAVHTALEIAPTDDYAVKLRDSLLTKLVKSQTGIDSLEELIHRPMKQPPLPYLKTLCKLYATLNNPQRSVNFAKSSLQKKLSKKQKIEIISEVGAYLDDNKYWSRAELVYTLSIEKYAYSPTILMNAGILYEKHRKYKRALSIYKMASKKYRKYSEWFNFRAGYVSYQLLSHKAAAAYFVESLRLHSQSKNDSGTNEELVLHSEAHKELVAYRRGCILYHEGKFRGACEYFLQSRAVPDNIHMPTAYNDLDDNLKEIALLRLTDKKKDITEITKAKIDLLTNHGKSLITNELWVSAYAIYRKILRLNEQAGQNPPAEIYRRLIESSRHAGKSRESIKNAEQAIKKFPGSLDINSEYALSLSSAGDDPSALSIWSKALENFPKEFSTWYLISAATASARTGNARDIKKWNTCVTSLADTNSLKYLMYAFNISRGIRHQLNTEKLIFGESGYSEYFDLDEIDNTIISTGESTLVRLSNNCPIGIRQRYSQTLVEKAETALRAVDSDTYRTYIRRSIDVLLLPTGCNELLNSIYTLTTESRLLANNQDTLILHIKRLIDKISLKYLSTQEWIAIYDYLCYNNFLELALLLREKSVHRALIESLRGTCISYESLRQRALAEAETQRFKEAFETIEVIKMYWPQNRRVLELENLVAMQSNNLSRIKNSFVVNDYHKNSEKTINNLVTQKNIAIVGPALSEFRSGNEIDSADTVVRFNYRGKESLSNKNYNGSKIDISYVNGPVAREYLTGEIPEFMADTKLCCLSLSYSHAITNAIDEGSVRPYGYITFLFHRQTNAIPMALYDIVRYKPKSIKIYNSNFYLSTQHYDNKYNKHHASVDAKISIDRLREMVSNHDFISQLRFIRNCYKSGLIQVDSNCQRVLDMSDTDYMQRLQQLFDGNYAILNR